jgi:ATP-dependent Lon protease
MPRKHSDNTQDGDESDSSVDSKGNLKGLIDYDSSHEEEMVPNAPPSTPHRKNQSGRPMRRAAIAALQRISEQCVEQQPSDGSPKNIVHYPTVRKITPSKRRYSDCDTQFSMTDIVDRDDSEHDPSYSNEFEDDEEMDDESDEEDEEDEEDDEEETEEEDEEIDLESESEEEDEDEEEEEDEDEYQDEEVVYEEEGSTSLGSLLMALRRQPTEGMMIPKKYNMKTEPESVQKFVKLLTSPMEENAIDTQIGQFKDLTEEKQNEIIDALENRPVVNDSSMNLMLKILTMKLPKPIQSMILSKYNGCMALDTCSSEYFKQRAWLEKVTSVPFGTYKNVPVTLDDGPEKCSEFMGNAKKCLDEAIYGQDESKLQIMQFISTKIANPNGRGLCLLLTGPPGIGKTSLIKNGIAKAMDWPFQFISLGGDSDASTYTGHQLVYESSHCGKIVNCLIAAKSMSMVMMFDEVDKISQTAKGEEVMNMLIHLTDPVQNGDFEDKYLSGIPIDLSKVMFVFSANDINKIDKILLDRMLVIELKGYDLKQKTVIAEKYLLPHALQEVNLKENITIPTEIITTVIQDYANEEKGVRELKRNLEQITQKVNMLRMYNSPELPFHIKDFTLPFTVKKEHMKLFLKKRSTDDDDAPPPHMYI